jgi:hypothetical protein
MVEIDTDVTKPTALDELREASGQEYIQAWAAFPLLYPFRDDVTDEFILDHTLFDSADEFSNDEDNGALALSGAVEDRQRSADEARGMTNVAPHEMLVTYSDVSAILAEAIGEEPSDYTAAGHGFTADGRHEENVEAVCDRLGK